MSWVKLIAPSPKRYTWQSDVETVHRLVENEFSDPEPFTDHASSLE